MSMKLKPFSESYIFFRYIQCDKLVLQVGSEEFPTTLLEEILKHDEIIIWGNRGIYRLIPIPIIHNLVTRYETARTLNTLYPKIKAPDTLNQISWDQGITISPEVARHLMSVPEKPSNPNPTADSTSEN